MSLARRSRAVAQARPLDARWHDLLLFGGMIATGSGVGFGVGLGAAAPTPAEQAALVVGIALLSYELGRRLVNPERAYMEGFTDGLVAAATFAAPTAVATGGHGGVPVVPAGVGVPDAGTVDGGTRKSQRFARNAIEQPVDWRDVAGVAFGTGPARPATGTYVDEPIRSGPRPPDFPPVPAKPALGGGPVDGREGGRG